MLEGDQFPPVTIGWRPEVARWTWRDGCHRYFAALVSRSAYSKALSFPPCGEAASHWR